MIPASLPICVFFTLYVLAAIGFFVMNESLTARDAYFADAKFRLTTCAVMAVLWPVIVVLFVIDFVRGRL